jgi:hypothetical protein
MSTLRAIKKLALKQNVYFGCNGNPIRLEKYNCEDCIDRQDENIKVYLQNFKEYKKLGDWSDLVKKPSDFKGLFIFDFKR